MDQYFCKKCAKVKAKSDFYFRYNRRITPCKECKRSYYKEWASENKEYHKKWKKDHTEKVKEYNRRYYENDRVD